jgi:hypothetical protein
MFKNAMRLCLLTVVGINISAGTPNRAPVVAGGTCYVCMALILSSCEDWDDYDSWCQGACRSLATTCGSNGEDCVTGEYKIECGG